MNFKEIETKYRANEIKLQDFKKLAKSFNPIRQIEVGSYDYYFVRGDDEFIRYRTGNNPQLTVKVKVSKNNNFVREEYNVPLDPSVSEEERLSVVSGFCSSLGFTHNFTIFKICDIYYYNNYNLVFYIVYDAEFKEKDRFIEIEMDERFSWESEDRAWSELLKIEKELSPLGITFQNRIRKSLFEMLRKI